MSRIHVLVRCLFVMASLAVSLAGCAAEPLPSWNEGPSKSAITSFVSRVTTAGSSDFIKPEDRIATFDNDGTLWCEQPMYFQI